MDVESVTEETLSQGFFDHLHLSVILRAPRDYEPNVGALRRLKLGGDLRGTPLSVV